MRIKSRTGAHALSFPGHEPFVAGADGVFEVPHEVGEELTAFPTLWAVDDTPPVETPAVKAVSEVTE